MFNFVAAARGSSKGLSLALLAYEIMETAYDIEMIDERFEMGLTPKGYKFPNTIPFTLQRQL